MTRVLPSHEHIFFLVFKSKASNPTLENHKTGQYLYDVLPLTRKKLV